MRKILEYAREHGAAWTFRRGCRKAGDRIFGIYDRKRRPEMPDSAELTAQKVSQPEAGLISVVIPVYNTDPGMLRALLDSLLAQTYTCMEAVLYDGGSTKQATVRILDEYAAKDARLKVIHAEVNDGISGNTNHALALASGVYTALCDHDDLLTPDALWRVAEAIAREHPDVLYSDEDRITEDGRHYLDPYHKPDFCPDNLNACNYICHLLTVRTRLLLDIGGLRSGFDGSQDHDLILRLTEKTDRIVHLPYTLYSWREVRSSASHRKLEQCRDAGCRAVKEHEERLGNICAVTPAGNLIRVRYKVPENTLTDVIRFDPDSPDVYADLNRKAKESTAEYLFFADRRLDIRHRETFMNELLSHAAREGIGAVTPVLTDKRGRIVHGGFVIGTERVAECEYEGLRAGAGGYHEIMNMTRNVSAVSPCALMIRRDRFIPFDERFGTGLGAVDLCLRLKEQGLRHIYTPYAEAVCRRNRMLLSGRNRDAADKALFAVKHGGIRYDPCRGRTY